MATKIDLAFPTAFQPANERVNVLLAGCSHYRRFDLPIFIAGYNELGRAELNGGRVLEVCCGVGELARQMARAFPRAEIIGLDRYPEAGRAIQEARKHEGLANARYHCGDALRLSEFPDASLDLVYGQATLHHLAHETGAAGREFSRVLKPGGRLVFIYEPLGHNPLWAMIRAYRTAQARLVDESNVVMPQLEHVAQAFSRCEVQLFNLLGYPLKSLGRLAVPALVRLIYRADATLMKWRSGAALMAANFNAIFTK